MSQPTFEKLLVLAIALPFLIWVGVEVWVALRRARRSARIWRITAYSLYRLFERTDNWDWPKR